MAVFLSSPFLLFPPQVHVLDRLVWHPLWHLPSLDGWPKQEQDRRQCGPSSPAKWPGHRWPASANLLDRCGPAQDRLLQFWWHGLHTIGVRTRRLAKSICNCHIQGKPVADSSGDCTSGGCRVVHHGDTFHLQEEVYWTDWFKRAIMKTNKYVGRPVTTFKSGVDEVMDLKIVHHAAQLGECTRSVWRRVSAMQGVCFVWGV